MEKTLVRVNAQFPTESVGGTKKHSYQKGAAIYAASHDCNVRTVRNWMREGAPLDDATAMTTWLAARKNMPPSAKTIAPAAAPASPLTEGEQGTGAASALRRLEDEEFKAWRDLQAALGRKPGNLLEIKIAREGWLKVSESLRKYDLLVEQSRRDSGELLPRSEVERILRALGWYLRLAGQGAAHAAARNFCGLTEPWQASRLLTRLYWETLLNALVPLTAASEGAMSAPAWVMEALRADLDTVLVDAGPTLKLRADTFTQLVEYNAKRVKA